MGKALVEPHRPVDDWQRKLEEWLADVERIIGQAKAWAEKREWATKLDKLSITEEVFGTYEAPQLLIHTAQGRLLLDPVGKDIIGAQGRFDFCVMPSYDAVPLIKTDGNWEFFPLSREDLRCSWSEESFEKVALELLKMK